MDNSIYTLNDYGKLEIKIKEWLNKKTWVEMNYVHWFDCGDYDLVNRYYNNRVIRIDIDIIARMYFVLNCDVSDILKYKKIRIAYCILHLKMQKRLRFSLILV